MRPAFWKEFEAFHHHLKPSGLPRRDIETMYSVELFAVGCLMVDPAMDIREGWTILAGYDSPVLPVHTRQEIAHRLRVLYSSLRSRTSWEQRFAWYADIAVEYRLFEQLQDGRWSLRTPILYSDRREWYESLLNRHVHQESRELLFASQGEFHYYKYTHEQEPVRYEGRIPSNPLHMTMFPRYRYKGSYILQIGENSLYQAESFREASASAEWVERGNFSIRLQHLSDPTRKTMDYKGLQHIVGGLGTGKSTLMVLETNQLVQAGARVGFIEGSVPQVLNRVKELRRIGIHAVPVIGKSSRSKHQEDFLTSRRDKIRDVTDWGADDQLELRHLSDFCMIQALTNDHDDKPDYPCRQLKQGDTKCLCPYAGECGIYKDYAQLISAEVWVTTSASILKTKLPSMLDPYERTIYEAMYDLLDVIFVDEADAVQRQFDDSFLSEVPLFGHSQHLFEKALLESLGRTIGQYGKYADDAVIQEWMDVLNRLESNIRRGIYRTLNRSPEYARFLYRKLIRLSTEAYRISGAFTQVDDELSRIENMLLDFTDHPLEHELFPSVNRLLEAVTSKERDQILSDIITQLGGTDTPHGKFKFPIESLEFYLCLSLIDHDMKRFMDLYPLAQARLGKLSDFDGLYSILSEFAPITKEAMTGRMTGYLYDVKPGHTTGTFKAVQYSVVGRLLLEDWHRAFEGIDDYEGPAVVLLSGTSLAPGSAHYNISSEPEWLLESNLPIPAIHQEFYPIYEKGAAKPIYVSGELEESRGRNLRILTSKLLPKIEQELLEWKARGTGRKVLLIVNSYEDVKEVGAEFAAYAKWNNRYRQLDRNPNPDREAEYSRAELEQFAKEKADVLIAPLLAISRGYNILDESKGSLFGSVLFLVRPYPIPHDMKYLVQVLHADLPELTRKAKERGLTYREAITFLRRESNSKLHRLYHKPDYWSVLKPPERKTIAWFTFIPIWQTIGRLLRKGTSARVFYCDGKFAAQPSGTDYGESMLDYWYKIMLENEHTPAFRSLYGPFIDSIRTVVERVDEDE